MQPAGFEALSGLTPKISLVPPIARPVQARQSGDSEKVAPAKPGKTAADRQRAREEAAAKRQEAEEKKREADIKKGEATVERAKAAESMARDTLERAKRDLADAEAALKRLRFRPS